MEYLTYNEFQKMNQSDIDELKFTSLLTKATAILDNITNHFYVRNDISVDNSWRVRQFKQALCAQIEYFKVLGATTFEEINGSPQSFSAGRTSVSNTSRFNAGGSNESKSLVAEDVFIFLEGTGLLYAGVATW